MASSLEVRNTVIIRARAGSSSPPTRHGPQGLINQGLAATCVHHPSDTRLPSTAPLVGYTHDGGVRDVLANPCYPCVAAIRRFGAAGVQLGAQLTGLPPQTGLFMVGAWFRGRQDVHWRISWITDSVHVDFPALQDSSIVAAQLDGMPVTTTVLILTVNLLAGARDSLAWDFR